MEGLRGNLMSENKEFSAEHLEVLLGLQKSLGEAVAAMNDVKAEIKSDLGELKASVAGHVGVLSATIKAIDDKHTLAIQAEGTNRASLRNEILGPGGRVVQIEEARKEEKRWERAKWLSGPVMVFLHAAGHKLGLTW